VGSGVPFPNKPLWYIWLPSNISPVHVKVAIADATPSEVNFKSEISALLALIPSLKDSISCSSFRHPVRQI